MRRKRLGYAVAIVVVIVAGLASRSRLAVHLPAIVAAYAGDTLWALTVFLALAFVLPGLPTSALAAATLGIAFAVEVSQLYRADWLNQIRATRVGALLLGAGFKWSDLLCYTAGMLMGVTGEWLVARSRRPCAGVEPKKGSYQ